MNSTTQNNNLHKDNRIKARIIKQTLIDSHCVHKLYSLYEKYFDNTSFDIFEKDFKEKDWVIVASDQNDTIYGFSTIQCVSLTCHNKKINYVFSGDTITSQAIWNSNILSSALGVFQNKLVHNTSDEWYWFLITKGARTYKSLPLFFNSFYPNFKTSTPLYETDILDTIALYKYGNHYNKTTNIISFNGNKDFLKPFMQEMPSNRSIDDHTSFFLSRNPGYRRGDELACIARISKDNFTNATMRVVASGKQNVTWVE